MIMNTYHYIGIAAAILSLTAIVPYIIDILRGNTKPERMSRVIWIIVGLLLISSYYSVGARETLWIIIAYTIYPAIILGFSVKYGVGGFTKLDIICLFGALFGVAAWYISRNAAAAFYIIIIIDVIGFAPTIKKTYFQPKTENTLAWQIGFVAALLNMFAIQTWSVNIFVYPMVTLFIMSVMTGLVSFPNFRLHLSR